MSCGGSYCDWHPASDKARSHKVAEGPLRRRSSRRGLSDRQPDYADRADEQRHPIRNGPSFVVITVVNAGGGQDSGSHPDFTQELPRKLLPTRAKAAQSHLRQNREFTRRCLWRVGSSLDLKRAHNPKGAGSNPGPATTKNEGLADAAAANPFVYPERLPLLPDMSALLRSSRAARRVLRMCDVPEEQWCEICAVGLRDSSSATTRRAVGPLR